MHLKIFVKYSLILQKWVPVMGGCWTWLFSLFGLFCNVYSFCISEENESDIWNKIALINESTMDNDWQFSSHLYRTSSKSIQDYGLLFLPRTCGCKTCSPNYLRGNHSLGEEDCGFCQLSTWPFVWEWDGSKGIPIWIDSLGSMNDRSRNRICTLIWM